MYPAPFEYYKPARLDEAIQLLANDEGAKVIAGGHSLLPMMRLRLARPSALVDIGGLSELRGINVEDGKIRIGALTTHYQIATSGEVKRHCPLLSEVAAGIGDVQVRNWGTIGGNLAHADPASDWATALTVLNGSVNIQRRRGRRTVPIGEFVTGQLSTILDEDENRGAIVTGVEIPVLANPTDGDHHHDEHGHGHGHGHGHHHITGDVGEYAKMAHPASYYSVVGGAVLLNLNDGTCTAARVAVGGLTPKPVRARSVETALVGKHLNLQNVAEAVKNLSDDLGNDVLGDVYASAAFRRQVAPVEVKHAIYHAIGLAHH